MGLLVVITGPTASGKTRISIDLARHFGASIISADARQVYRYLNIGTNKITPEETQGIPHYLIDTAEPDETYTAGRFVRDVNELLPSLFKSNELVFLVGGTGFYIQALIQGLDEMPIVSDEIKMSLNQQWTQEGLVPLLDELQQKDPITYQSIDIQNPKRVLRALEVIRASGLPFSAFKGKKESVFPYKTLFLIISDQREILYERINQRVLQMLDSGLIRETEHLIKAGYDPKLTSLQTIGYQEPIRYLQGTLSYEEMIVQIQQNSRHYAKRQMTWCRNGIQKFEKPDNIYHLSPDEADKAKTIINTYLNSFTK